MKDSLLCVHVVVKTLNLEISRCHSADYVVELCLSLCSTCSTIIFTHSTNQIIVIWCRGCRCRHPCLSSNTSTTNLACGLKFSPSDLDFRSPPLSKPTHSSTCRTPVITVLCTEGLTWINIRYYFSRPGKKVPSSVSTKPNCKIFYCSRG